MTPGLLNEWVSLCPYVMVALMWLIPNRRIDKCLGAAGELL